MNTMVTIARDGNGELTLWEVELDATDGVTLLGRPTAVLNIERLPEHVEAALERGYRAAHRFVPAHEIEGLES